MVDGVFIFLSRTPESCFIPITNKELIVRCGFLICSRYSFNSWFGYDILRICFTFPAEQHDMHSPTSDGVLHGRGATYDTTPEVGSSEFTIVMNAACTVHTQKQQDKTERPKVSMR